MAKDLIRLDLRAVRRPPSRNTPSVRTATPFAASNHRLLLSSFSHACDVYDGAHSLNCSSSERRHGLLELRSYKAAFPLDLQEGEEERVHTR